MAGVPKADCFKEASIGAQDVITSGSEDMALANLPPGSEVSEGFALSELVKHINEAIGREGGGNGMVSVGGEVMDVSI